MLTLSISKIQTSNVLFDLKRATVSLLSQSIQSTKKDLEVIVIFFLITVLNLFPNQNLTNVNPSPMKLCRKISPNVSNSGIEYECMSCPDSDNELSYSEETQPFSPIEDDSNAVNELRKEMMKIRTSTQDEKVSNEYESVLKIDDLLN